MGGHFIITQMANAPLLQGYSYPSDLIQEYKDRGQLLSLRMSLVPRETCNLDCAYCYTTSGDLVSPREQLTFEQRTSAINEAVQLCIKSVVCVGDGEPLLYQQLRDLIQFLNEKGITFVTFSNLTLMTREMAQFLHDNNVTVIGKCDGPEEIQDLLCGRGTYSRMQKGIKTLLDVGYGSDGDVFRFGLGTVVCSANLELMPDLWREMRRRRIFPNFERATLIGSALKRGITEVTPIQTAKLMGELKEIDENEFGYTWPAPYGPIPGHQCYLFYAGTHLNTTGGVCPCPELPPVSFFPEQSLAEILRSETYERIRHADQYIEGTCKGCEHLSVCFGCRSKAYRTCGSIFGEDPYCSVALKKVGK